MWYGRLATTSYGGSTSWTRSWSSASPSISARAASTLGSNRSRRNAARPRSSSTAVTAAPGVEQAAGQQPETRADLEDPPTRAGVRLGAGSPRARPRRPGSSARGAWRARRPAARSVARTACRVDPRRPPVARHRAASGSDGRASRSSPARSPAANRRAPAAPIIAPLSVHRRRPRHDQRQAERLRLAGEARPQGACWPRRRRRARSTARRPPRPPGSSSWRARRRRRPGSPRRARPRPRPAAAPSGVVGQALVGPGLGDDPPGRGLEAGEAEVERVAEPGPREDAVVAGRRLGAARSPARPGSRGRAAGRPCRTPRRPRRRRSCRAAGRSGGRASRRGTCGRPTRRARRAGRPGPRRSAVARVAQPGGVDVALEVVDPDQRPVVDPGERLREVDPDEQRAGQARAVGDRDRVDVVPARRRRPPRPRRGRARSSAGGPGRRPRGRSRPMRAWSATCDATTLREDPPAALDERDPGLVARRLDGEDERAAHRARAPRRRPAAGSAPAPRRGRRAGAAIRSRIGGSASGSVVMIRASSLSSL